MARSFIKAATAVVSILIDAVEYNDTMDTVAVRPDAPEIETTVFSTENDGGESELGVERLTIDLSGPQAKGSTSSVPFIPLSAYQSKSLAIDFDVNCGITATTASARSHPGVDSRAGGARRNNGRFVTIGAFAVSWDDGVS